MMRALVISDTHGSTSSLNLALKAVGKIDAAIHLGDTVADAKQLQKMIGDIPIVFVRGNCDPISSGGVYEVLDWEGVRILATHGHEDGVRWGLTGLCLRAEECGATVALYGHTHIPSVDRLGNMWVLNPGSPALPRAGSPATVGLLEIDRGRAFATTVRV